MRTTVTIDPDVERRLRQAMRARKLSFKEALNEAVRHGLDSLLTNSKAKVFHTRPENMGLYAHLNYDNIGELLELADKSNSHAAR